MIASGIEKVRAPAREQTLAKPYPATAQLPTVRSGDDPPLALIGLDGLDEAQVRARVARGQRNVVVQLASRSFAQILRANVLTRFNALLGTLFLIMLWVGPARDALFGFLVVANTLIGLLQELRAKRVLDRLALVVAPKALVARAGLIRELPCDEVVLDDILELRAGDQVPVDGLVRTAQGLELDESLLTGESRPVPKQPNDSVLSGSFVVAGTGRIQATRVGDKAYASSLAEEARKFKLARSELRAAINRILFYLSWLLIPASGLLVARQLLYTTTAWRDAVRSSVAAIVGMVPEGLVLLTSVALAIAVVRLGRRGVLVQELPSVEMLARVDVLCFDKTGTLTDGRVTLERLLTASTLEGASERFSTAFIRDALGALAAQEPQPDSTLAAIVEACPRPLGAVWRAVSTVPFSSTRKWSAVEFAEYGTWILGAPEIVLTPLPASDGMRVEADRIARAGRRVLALAHSTAPLTSRSAEHAFPSDLRPTALVILSEHVRKDAAASIQYFASQGVSAKVLSGDNPGTVSAVCTAVGMSNASAPLDARDLTTGSESLADAAELHSVFGRTSPHDKRDIIAALQSRGHVVAMIGDGVNDVLALKQADLGIVVSQGSSAGRAVAQIVLLENGLAGLPDVVGEGRRVIANVERTASLFMTKTTYVMFIALAVGVAGVMFPFLPRHLTLIGTLTIGVPGFFVALAPNTTRAQPGFLRRVLRFSIPAGCIAAAATLAAYAIARQTDPNDIEIARTAATLMLITSGLSILDLLNRPAPHWWRWLLAILGMTFAIILAVPLLRDFFGFELPRLVVWTVVAAASGINYLALRWTHGR
jgi:cation-transporting ATPase E